MSAAPEDVWTKVLALARAVDSRSYYQLLGVNMDASGEDLERAFQRSSALLRSLGRRAETHPDRRHAVEQLSSRLAEAREVLAQPSLRRQYDRGLESGVLRLRRVEPLPPPPPVRAARGTAEPPIIADTRATLPLRPEHVRTDVRHPFEAKVRVRCSTWSDFLTLHANNISSGGLFVRAATPLPKGTAVRLRIVLPQQYTLELEAEVVRLVDGPNPGMGLSFRPMDDFRKSIVDHLVREARAADHRVNDLEPAPVPIDDDETTTRYEPEPVRPSSEDLNASGAAAALALESLDPNIGHDLLAAGHYAKARDAFTSAILSSPRDPSLRAGFHLACAYLAQKDNRPDIAHEHFERALIFDKTCAAAIRALRS